MKHITTLMLMLFVSYSWAQAPEIQWQRTYGSSTHDYPLGGIIQTSDGGYLTSGYSNEGADLDKSSTVGRTDYWVIRLDENGNKLWDRTFGGSEDDILTSAVETGDGGFLLGGYSASPVSGDKTESHKGGYDYWVIKIDGFGNKLWDVTLGGSSTDQLQTIAAMGGGRYALAGSSASAAGEGKSSHLGGRDYWVVLIDDSGQVIWERAYGGSSDDYLQSAAATGDGGLIMAGYSISPVSHDKTEPSRGTTYDYWIVKIDGNGHKNWDRTLGGTGSDLASAVAESPDGGFLVGGRSNSTAGYDKTRSPLGGSYPVTYCVQSCGGWGGSYCCQWRTVYYYYEDYWVVKLTSGGSKQWDRVYGTASTDVLQGITAVDEGFVLTGYSSGPASYDKSEDGRGGMDAWMLQVDASGNRLWDKTVGGSNHDHQFSGSTALADDGGLISAIHSASGISGDKTDQSKGYGDYWIVKFQPTADRQAPVFETALVDITTSVGEGTCSALVTWLAPTVTDNVGVTSMEASHPPGSLFPFGETLVTYTAMDAAGNSSTASFTVKVEDNEAPVPQLDELPILTGECGVEVTVIPVAVDNCSNEIQGTTDAPLSYSEQGTEATITWTYDDGNGNIFQQLQTVRVKDVTPPTISPLADIDQPVEKGLCGARILFEEPAADDNCGLKSFARVDAVPYHSGDIFPEGSFEIIYQAIDVGDNVTVMSFRVTVTNNVPVITSVSTSVDPNPVGTSIPVAVAFIDENLVDSQIDWGDGTTSAGTLGEGTVTGEHTYTAPGVYSINVKIVDACDAEASALYQYVVIYDPYGGFVTGGGWFNSPAGAYAYNAQATGKASFGFVAKYQKGSSVPMGNTDFQFHAADLRFRSTSYSWLVVAGYKAMYKGAGELNGSSGYGFLISAVDGAKTSTTSSDKFRIKIWDAAGSVVYDNQLGAGDDAEATTTLSGGSIVIHDGGKSGPASARTSTPPEVQSGETEERPTAAFPNPFKDVVTVEFHSAVESDVTIDVLDVTGRSIHAKSHPFSKSGSYEINLGTEAVVKKVYFVKVMQGRRVEFVKVVRE